MNREYSVYIVRWEECRVRNVEASSEEEAQERGRDLLTEGAEFETIDTGIDHIDADPEDEG